MKYLFILASLLISTISFAKNDCAKIVSEAGWDAVITSNSISEIANRPGTWSQWRQAICLNSGVLQSQIKISMAAALDCVGEDFDLNKKVTDLFNKNTQVGDNCFEKLSREQVRYYYRNLAQDLGSFLKLIE
jgi:hypothetical protein